MLLWPAKLDRGENGGHYKMMTNPQYTVGIVTHLEKSPVERVTILDKSAYCPWYEIDKNTVDRRHFASFNNAAKKDTLLLVWDVSGFLGVLPCESAK